MIKLPKDYEEEMRGLLGQEFEAYLKTYEQPLRQGMRVNTYKLTKEKWESMTPFGKEQVPWIENGYYIDLSLIHI